MPRHPETPARLVKPDPSFGVHKGGPKVTVLTATFNALDELKRTVESVAEQTCRDVEHVIIDGGSTDGTVEWLAGLGDEVRWLSEPDGGIADALNKGLAMARGEYLLVLQAEDTFLGSESLALAMPHLLQGIDIVFFDIVFGGQSGERRVKSRGLSSAIAFQNGIPHQGVFCRRDLFRRLGPFDTSFRIGMDYEFFLRAYLANATTRLVPEVLSRMPNTGISSRRDWPSLYCRFDEFRRAQSIHFTGAGMRAMYSVYWPLYLLYRRSRSALRV